MDLQVSPKNNTTQLLWKWDAAILAIRVSTADLVMVLDARDAAEIWAAMPPMTRARLIDTADAAGLVTVLDPSGVVEASGGFERFYHRVIDDEDLRDRDVLRALTFVVDSEDLRRVSGGIDGLYPIMDAADRVELVNQTGSIATVLTPAELRVAAGSRSAVIRVLDTEDIRAVLRASPRPLALSLDYTDLYPLLYRNDNLTSILDVMDGKELIDAVGHICFHPSPKGLIRCLETREPTMITTILESEDIRALIRTTDGLAQIIDPVDIVVATRNLSSVTRVMDTADYREVWRQAAAPAALVDWADVRAITTEVDVVARVLDREDWFAVLRQADDLTHVIDLADIRDLAPHPPRLFDRQDIIEAVVWAENVSAVLDPDRVNASDPDEARVAVDAADLRDPRIYPYVVRALDPADIHELFAVLVRYTIAEVRENESRAASTTHGVSRGSRSTSIMGVARPNIAVHGGDTADRSRHARRRR